MSRRRAAVDPGMNDIRRRFHHVLEDTVYYFWVAVGLTFGAVTIVRFLLPSAKRPPKARP